MLDIHISVFIINFCYYFVFPSYLQDDDSDLEFELEVYPTVNSDVAADIAACVKVITYPTSLVVAWSYLWIA